MSIPCAWELQFWGEESWVNPQSGESAVKFRECWELLVSFEDLACFWLTLRILRASVALRILRAFGELLVSFGNPESFKLTLRILKAFEELWECGKFPWRSLRVSAPEKAAKYFCTKFGLSHCQPHLFIKLPLGAHEWKAIFSQFFSHLPSLWLRPWNTWQIYHTASLLSLRCSSEFNFIPRCRF